MTTCKICGKDLTDPISVDLEIGPICRKEHWQVEANLLGASFSFDVVDYKDLKVVVIIDLDGPVSVTNDVENVLLIIAKQIDLTDKKIIYRDSMKTYDGINLVGRRFYPLNETELTKALEKLKRRGG